MKKMKMFYLEHCPFCKRAFQYIEELKAEHPELASIDIETIEESQHPEIADQYDYYYVPTFYLGEDKLFEGHMEKADVKAVLDKALESIG